MSRQQPTPRSDTAARNMSRSSRIEKLPKASNHRRNGSPDKPRESHASRRHSGIAIRLRFSSSATQDAKAEENSTTNTTTTTSSNMDSKKNKYPMKPDARIHCLRRQLRAAYSDESQYYRLDKVVAKYLEKHPPSGMSDYEKKLFNKVLESLIHTISCDHLTWGLWGGYFLLLVDHFRSIKIKPEKSETEMEGSKVKKQEEDPAIKEEAEE